MSDHAAASLASPARPVILGAGLTGLAISRALARQGVVHVLVGQPPGDTPRLGESLNAEGSLELQRQCPDLRRFFHPKRQQRLFFGEHVVRVDFLPLWTGRCQDLLMGLPPEVELLHLDRVGFDAALFESVVADSHCTFLNDRAKAVAQRQGRDRVLAIELASGRRLACNYVFDATQAGRFLASQLGIARSLIGPKRRVVFAHYHRDQAAMDHGEGNDGADDPSWLQATSLLRLEADSDRIQGLAWCIPLGEYVSLGVSVDPETTTQQASVLLDFLEKAYERRGLAVRESFPQRGHPLDGIHAHYNHDRCAGSNWLMTGPTCCQFWFPAAAGVASGLLAARLAVDCLRDPDAASQYQRYLNGLAAAHGKLDWLPQTDPATQTAESLRQRMEAMVVGNVWQYSRAPLSSRRGTQLAVGEALLKFYQADRMLAQPVKVEKLIMAG
ncbi:MAG: hypothetical protein VKP63_09985 [Cyanobacteriota bacterium]|nr:hypothetical protein [Cyanobacteriota bacterium]